MEDSRMGVRLIFLALTFATLPSFAAFAREEKVANYADEAEIKAATGRARREVDAFIKKLDAGECKRPSIKVPVKDGDKIEYFWLRNVAHADGWFTGLIDSAPELVTNVKSGQEIRIRKTEITDWLYLDNGQMIGNYTLRVLLKRMPKEEADAIRKQFKWEKE